MHNHRYRATWCSKVGQLAAPGTDHNSLCIDFEDTFWKHYYTTYNARHLSPVFQRNDAATSGYGKRVKQPYDMNRNRTDHKMKQPGSTTMHTLGRGGAAKNRGIVRNQACMRGGNKLGFRNWKANRSTSRPALLEEKTKLGDGTKSINPSTSSSFSSQCKSTKTPCLRTIPISSFSSQSHCTKSPCLRPNTFSSLSSQGQVPKSSYLRTNPTSFGKVSCFSKGESEVAGSSLNPLPTTEDKNSSTANCSTDNGSRCRGMVASPIAVGVRNERVTDSIPRAEMLKEKGTLGHGTMLPSLLSSAFSAPEIGQIDAARPCRDNDIEGMGSNGNAGEIRKSNSPTHVNNNSKACWLTTFSEGVVADSKHVTSGVVSECPDAGESNNQIAEGMVGSGYNDEICKSNSSTDVNNNNVTCSIPTSPEAVIADAKHVAAGMGSGCPNTSEGNSQSTEFVEIAADGEHFGEGQENVSLSPAPLSALASTDSNVSANKNLPKWHHIGTTPLVMNISFDEGHFKAACGGEDKTVEHPANNQFSINVDLRRGCHYIGNDTDSVADRDQGIPGVPAQSVLNGNLPQHNTANLFRITVDDRERNGCFQPSSAKKAEKLTDKLRQIEKKYTEESKMLSGVFCFISRKLPDQEEKLGQCLAEMLEILGKKVYSSCFQLLENGFSEHEISGIKDYSSMPFSVLISQIMKKEDAKLMSVNPSPPQVHGTMEVPGE